MVDPNPAGDLRADYASLLAGGVERFFEVRRSICPWCGGTDLRTRVTVPDLFQRKPGTFVLDECAGCGHVFQNPRLTPEGLDFYYRDFYDGLGAEDMERLFSLGVGQYRRRAEMVARRATPRRWLDVGGGHGHFCRAAAERLPDTRFEALDQGAGIDEAARRGWVERAHRGLFVDVADDLTGAFDVVSMLHYLEHTRDPRAELRAAHHVLEPGGLLLIELPDPECRFGRLLGRYWLPWLQPQHQHLLSTDRLCAELADLGFTVVDRERAEAHQPGDLALGVWLLAQRLAPAPDRPWVPTRTRAQRAGRTAVMVALTPAMVLAYAVDRAAAPLVRRRPGGPNAFRVLARRD